MSVLFFTIVIGTVEFSRMVWQDNTVASAAKDGARWAAVHGATADTTATATSVQDFVRSRAYGLPVTVTTTWNPEDQRAGSIVTVTVQGSFRPIVPLLPQSTVTLHSSAQMVISR